jgi:hypothetical protein
MILMTQPLPLLERAHAIISRHSQPEEPRAKEKSIMSLPENRESINQGGKSFQDGKKTFH